LDALIPKYHSLIAFISQLTNDILSIPISLKKQQLNSGAVDHTVPCKMDEPGFLSPSDHVLLVIGMLFTAEFFVYEVTSTKHPRDISKKLLIILVASHFKGFGVLFLLLWVSIYV
uniref:Dolichyl-diphosphooligosaccharide-protein glycosyltransferase subunit TMEM258 n=2 Tax=Sus scrofa TaxID=9823 RepID=A0A8D2A3B2_PIG